jgi:hypothetical protein
MPSRSTGFQQRLISAADDRGIVLSKEDIDLIQNSGTNSRLAEWAERTLQPQCLISLEEKEL